MPSAWTYSWSSDRTGVASAPRMLLLLTAPDVSLCAATNGSSVAINDSSLALNGSSAAVNGSGVCRNASLDS
eukprot:2065088-Rhodomonas_salina.1